MSEQDWLQKDFYKELGVDKTADETTIKKAYRKLARKYHPDQNAGDASAEARFKDISEAYTVLSDKKQREKYDAIRQMAGGGPRFTSGGAGFEDLFGGMFNSGTYTSGAAFDPSDLGSIFGGMFGGGSHANTQGAPFGSSPFGAGFNAQGFDPSGFGGAHHYGAQASAPEKGGDLKSSVKLSFAQALKGTEIRLTVNGKKISARVPAGVKDGQKIKLAGKGKAGKNGGASGDLILSVSVTPDDTFWREGNDLHTELPISLSEAALGATLTLKLLNGSTVEIPIPAATSSHDHIRLAGKGVKTSRGSGDLVVHPRIVMPQKLSSEALAAVEAFTQAHPDFDPRASVEEESRKG